MYFSIKRTLSTICLSLGLLFAVHSSCLASTDSDAVVDDYGNFVSDSNGNCVRTIWDNESDPCVVKREIIAKIMRLDERIAYFGFNQYHLTHSEKEKLAVVAALLKQYNIRAVRIVGFTDRIGSDEYNAKLSEKRANAVSEYLNSLVKLDKSIIHLRGLGKSNQVKSCDEIKNRKELIHCLGANRRVEVEVDFYDFSEDKNDDSDDDSNN